jgi:hypothetical protein
LIIPTSFSPWPSSFFGSFIIDPSISIPEVNQISLINIVSLKSWMRPFREIVSSQQCLRFGSPKFRVVSAAAEVWFKRKLLLGQKWASRRGSRLMSFRAVPCCCWQGNGHLVAASKSLEAVIEWSNGKRLEVVPLFFRMVRAEETSTKIRQWSRMMAPRWLRFDLRSWE